MTNNATFDLNLYRKVRYFRRVENAPVSLDDLLNYRWMLLQSGMPHDDLSIQELRTIEKWIKNLDRPYVSDNDLTDLKEMHLGPMFSDEMFESLLPQFIGILTKQSDWVCLFHVMIYDGWMNPVDFYTWVDWLNERAEAICLQELVSTNSRRQIDKYLTTPEPIKWKIEDYCKSQEKDITRVRPYFRHLCDLIDQIRDILGTIQEEVFTL